MAPTTPRRPRPRTLVEWLAGPPRRSQRWLANEVGCNQSMISMLAQHKRAARGDLALKIQKVTGLPLKVLIARTLPDDVLLPDE